MTDPAWLGAFLTSGLVFLTMAFAGYAGGDARKLLAPRDYRGQYCGLGGELQWNSGKDLRDAGTLSYMMNVSGTVDAIVAQLMCSSAAEAALQDLLHGSELDAYLCACCKRPCRSCATSAGMEDMQTPEELARSIDEKMGELTNPSRLMGLFSADGANAGAFSSVLLAVDFFFVETCTRSCFDAGLAADAGADWRRHRFRPAPDNALRRPWDVLAGDRRPSTAPIRRTIESSFEFRALPAADCPYDARYCVPFPGISLAEGPGGYCSFRLAPDVAAAMSPAGGEAVASGLLSFGDLRHKVSTSLGSVLGDVLASLDVLVLVAAVALCFGFLCMLLLRFFIKLAMWGFLLGVPAALIAGGAVGWVSTDRCHGETLVQAVPTYASAWGGSLAAWWNDTNTSAEVLSGSGEDYRGVQVRARSGRTCQNWDVQHPHPHGETSVAYPDADLRKNYCRNPNGTAVYIWCYTTDPATRWELCETLGAPPLQHDCPSGHSIRDSKTRQALKGVSVAAWVLATVWLVLVACMYSRIKLAITVYDAASVFVVQTPLIIAVPAVQTVIALLWAMFWFYSAATLLTQVTGDHVASEALTVTEAFGAERDDAEPGRCGSRWPSGFPWHGHGEDDAVWDDCSGWHGDTKGMQPRCWHCAPPRYALDLRFAVAFAMFLWTNELILAAGMCVVAASCGAWFFATADKRRSLWLSHRTVMLGVRNTFVFHFGSLALGAAIVTLVHLLRYALLYLERQAKGHQNKVSERALQCLKCCFCAFERCVKFVSAKAYIQVALMGTPFCSSAKAAFYLIARHPVNFLLLGTFSNLLRRVGVAFIVVSSSLVGFLCLGALEPDISPAAPAVACLLLAYSIGSAFMNVFGLAAETILQCVRASREMDLPDERLPKDLRQLRHNGAPLATAEEKMKKKAND